MARELRACINTPRAVSGTGSSLPRTGTRTIMQRNRTIGRKAMKSKCWHSTCFQKIRRAASSSRQKTRLLPPKLQRSNVSKIIGKKLARLTPSVPSFSLRMIQREFGMSLDGSGNMVRMRPRKYECTFYGQLASNRWGLAFLRSRPTLYPRD